MKLKDIVDELFTLIMFFLCSAIVCMSISSALDCDIRGCFGMMSIAVGYFILICMIRFIKVDK